MSAHVEVVTSSVHRAKVKVTPGTHMVDVLNEACKKLNLPSDKYLLKHKQKIVDLAQPFRVSGLVAGAKLELVQQSSSPAVVSLALDVDGRRFTKDLPSNMMLWKVLRQFEAAEPGLNLTTRSKTKSGNTGQGEGYHAFPVINIVGREYSTIEDLMKTLSQCGINSGRAALRISFRETEEPLRSALSEIGEFLQDVEPSQKTPQAQEPPKAPEATPETSAASTDPMQIDEAPIEKTPQSSQANEARDNNAQQVLKVDEAHVGHPHQEVKGDIAGPDDFLRPVKVFAAPSSSTPAAAKIQEDDSVYVPTIAHAQLHQTHLAARSHNQRLKSDAELAADAAEAAAKLAKIVQVEVRVRFPDQMVAQWVMKPEHTGSSLYQAVRASMAHSNQPFKLRLAVPGSPIIIKDDNKRLIADYKFKTRELLNLVLDDPAPDNFRKAQFLKSDIAGLAQAIVVPEVPQIADEDTDQQAAAGAPKPTTAGGKSDSKGPLSGDVRKKLGKLFKLPGK